MLYVVINKAGHVLSEIHYSLAAAKTLGPELAVGGEWCVAKLLRGGADIPKPQWDWEPITHWNGQDLCTCGSGHIKGECHMYSSCKR